MLTFSSVFFQVLPLFVMETFGWSSTGSGLIFLCIFIPSLLGPSIGMSPIHNIIT